MQNVVQSYCLSSHYVTELIVRHQNNRQLHAGNLAVLVMIRRTYWIVLERSTVRRYKGLHCKLRLKKAGAQQMGNLPAVRIHRS